MREPLKQPVYKILHAKKHPLCDSGGGDLELKAGDDLLSHGKRHTTISAKRFHF